MDNQMRGDAQHAPPPFKEYTKLVMVGTGGVGKSALTLQFMYDEFVEDYEPTKADVYRKTMEIEGRQHHIDIIDTAGQEDYVGIKDNFFRSGEGFMCLVAVNDRDSVERAKELREQIMRVKGESAKFCFVLVANKVDLEASGERVVSAEELRELADAWRVPYFETSAKTRQNVDQVFIELTKQVDEMKLQNDMLDNARYQKSKKGRAGKKHICTLLCCSSQAMT